MDTNKQTTQAVTGRLRVVQNLGLIDRVVRGLMAVLLIAGPIIHLALGNILSWHGYVMLAGIYPALTSILGCDPFYAMLKVRSCGTSDRTQCGTFPYEVDAALGNSPIPIKGSEHDHSLYAANHRKS